MTPAPVVARTSSPAATRALAAALAGVLEPGDLVLLVGELGTGKTTFVQGLARGLGVTEPVTSPTFTLVRAYATAGATTAPTAAAGAGGATAALRTLYHADLYRLERLSDVVDLGLGEMAEDEAVAVVEWGDVGRPVFGPDALTVHLSAEAAEEQRTLRLVTDGTWSTRRARLAERLRPWSDGAPAGPPGRGEPPPAGGRPS